MPKHILLVDDEPHITCLLGKRLMQSGYSVTTCFNGQEAVQAIDQQKPDMLLTDYQMPDCDGLWLAQQLVERGFDPPIPVFMLTARGHKIDPALQQQLNIRRILPKPFSGREIQQLVFETIGPAESTDQKAA